MIAIACLFLTIQTAAISSEGPVHVLPGQTSLAEIGMYTVGYQSYGKDPVAMPFAWVGHFDALSGISYMPQERILGRNAILIHPPWKIPTGKTWVDYRIGLPDVTPITLSLGVAMKPEVAIPGKSDGVTFSVFVIDAVERELTREHWAEGQWKEFQFDLSEWKGREITLRLQTEPGPARDASWDYAYFGDPIIVCGNESSESPRTPDVLTGTHAYRAVQKLGTQGLSNIPDHGILPGNQVVFKNKLSQEGEGYQFVYEGEDCRVVYEIRPQSGTLNDLLVRIDQGEFFSPALDGGVRVPVQRNGQIVEDLVQGGQCIETSMDRPHRRLEMLWQYQVDGRPFRVQWSFAISGKALKVDVTSEDPLASGFSLGQEGRVPLRRRFRVPYLLGSLSYLPQENLYVCRYLDWTQSHGSQCPQGEAVYDRKTDGTRNALLESGYIAVSPNVLEVLPNIPYPASPHLKTLAPLILLDIWGHHKGTYEGDAEHLLDLKDNGVDHLAIISHVWQRYGYDVKLPDHLPANPDFGGNESMVTFGEAANRCGYLWSLHENYIDLYPDAPSYDPTARVFKQDGSPSLAWFNQGTGVQSFGLKCNRALGYAQQNSPEIHRLFQTQAAYLDVHTCVPPWHQLDHEASQPMAGMSLLKVQRDRELFQFERDTHQGPLFGEGCHHFFWAGLCDGVEAQVEGGQGHAPFLDFDLLKIHPQMVNHGMGYYERWFEEGYNLRWGFDAGTLEQIDQYRCQELSYGHAGFIGAAQTDNLQWVAKEHHMMHPLQRLYGAAKPLEILYEVQGQWVTASVALAMGETRRQRIRYDSGLTLWTNWEEKDWEVEGRRLPPWGFLGLGPDTEVSLSLRENRFSDFAECPEFLFVDARTSFHMPYLSMAKAIEPRLSDFQYLGGNRISVTYEWGVKDTLGEDAVCFVHFTHSGAENMEGIVFQQDHGTTKPSSQWRPGDVIVDGPYEIEVPEKPFDAYDILIGLHKGSRVPLTGPQAPGGRILIGRLQIQREAGKIKSIQLGDISDEAQRLSQTRMDFSARLNSEGTWIDFGKVATDGSVKIEKEKDSLTLFPYPRNKAFKVALDLARILGRKGIDPTQARVEALTAGTQASMGEIPCEVVEGRLRVQLGMKGAGRYRVALP